MSDGSDAPRDSSVPPPSGPVSGRPMPPRRRKVLERIASIGASAQAAIPGLYAWAITVAPAAWSRGAPVLAKAAAIVGVLALVTAPLVEGAGPAISPDANAAPPGRRRTKAFRSGGRRSSGRCARGPVRHGRVPGRCGGSFSRARSCGRSRRQRCPLRGSTAFAGRSGWWGGRCSRSRPQARRSDSDPNDGERRIIASTSLKPRSELPRGDGAYVAVGVVLALSMQAVGWGVPVPERAVLVRLVTVVCGIAVLGGTTSIALARHTTRSSASGRLRLRRALPWLVMLALFAVSGLVLGMAR